MKVAVTIKGFIDIPDSWSDPEMMKNNPYFPLDVADYHYNDKLDAEDAIEDLTDQLKAYKDDFEVDFARP